MKWRYYVLSDTGVRFNVNWSPRLSNVCLHTNASLVHDWFPQSPRSDAQTCRWCHLRREPIGRPYGRLTSTS